MMNQSTTILLAGATGRVGNKIAQTILNRNAELRLLVRPQSTGKTQLKPLVRRGATIFEGDVMEPESLKPAVEGVGVVMSALRGKRSLMVEGQAALAESAKKAGARRIIPSGFSSELFNVDLDDENIADNAILGVRREAAQAMAATGLPATHLMNGTFMGSMLDFPSLAPFNFDAGTFEYWENGKQPAAYTTLTDAVQYAVEAALDVQPPEQLRVAGDVLTMKEMKTTYEQITGRTLEEHRLGSIEDLRNQIARLKTQAESPEEYMIHQIRYVIASGAGGLEPLDNEHYPSVKPSAFEDFLKTTDEQEI